MNELALFAGVGGGILGSLLAGHRVVCAVEKEPYCREVLLRRQRDGVLPMFPIWDDIRTFNGREWRGAVDIVTAGFPCQPFSVAGKQRGADDERNLWPETIRVIREVRPPLTLLENVPGLLGSHGYFGRVLGDLAESGMDAWWYCIPSTIAGAPQPRRRVWAVAHPHGVGLKGWPQFDSAEVEAGIGKARDHAARLDSIAREPCAGAACRVCRRGHAVSGWLDRLRATGNAQVPAVVARILEGINS